MNRYMSRKSVNGKPCALRGASTVWRGDYTNQYSETIQGGVFLPYHWTKHETRLNRQLSYPQEELVAELGSMFLSGLAGIPQDEELFSNHASYVDSWLSCLHDDTSYLFKAATEATKAAEYILNLSTEE